MSRCPSRPSLSVWRSLRRLEDSGHPRDCIYMTPSSSGWRKTSRTWRRNSGNSSRQSTPWWASDTSPGIGTWPPPISPASEMVWWARATRAGRDQRRAVAGEARDAVDTRGLNGLGEGHRRQDGGEPPCQHRLARPRGAKEQVALNTKISSGFIDMTRLGPCEHSLEARPHQRLERLIVDLPTMGTCPPLPQHCMRGEAFRTAERLLEAGEHLR
jgi:hypothetical protein